MLLHLTNWLTVNSDIGYMPIAITTNGKDDPRSNLGVADVQTDPVIASPLPGRQRPILIQSTDSDLLEKLQAGSRVLVGEECLRLQFQ